MGSPGTHPPDTSLPQTSKWAFGFAAFVLAGCTGYLVYFQWTINAELASVQGHFSDPGNLGTAIISGQIAAFRMALALHAAGLYCGIGLLFMGFALFLVGVKGNITVAATNASGGLKASNLAPGSLAILCAAVIIGWCAGRTPSLQFSTGTGPEISQGAATKPLEPPANPDQ